MRPLAELVRCVSEGVAWAGRQPGVVEVEVFAAANASLLCRLNYTSHIPSNGVEEPKSTESWGVGVRAVFDAAGQRLVGFGSAPADLGREGVARALARARAAAVHDPAFVGLPRPGAERRTLRDYHDPALMALDDEGLVALGWRAVRGGLGAFLASSRLAELAGDEARVRALGLVLGGDVTVLQERVAIASTHLPAPETDESTLLTAAVTAMVEARAAKGSGWATAARLDAVTEEAGAEAARQAIAAADGVRVPSGRYPVVLGRQPVADLVDNLLVPALSAGAFYAGRTPFRGRLGRRVAAPVLSVVDDGARPGLMGSKGVTCEGLPTGRTELIREGVLVGCLSNWYETQRLLRDPDLVRKLGAAGAEAARALAPRNGFRFAAGGGRRFDVPPGVAASNVVVEGAEPVPLEELLRRVGHGLYIGRIWYTYPINGLAAGDFTCTVVGDSFVIRDGRLAEPIRPNTLRINDNLAAVLEGVIGVGRDRRGVVLWAADEVVYTPELAVAGLEVEAIAEFVDALA